MHRAYDWPIAVRTLDLSRPLTPITGVAGYSRVRLFVSRGDELLGSVDIWNSGAETISVHRLRDAIADRLAEVLFRRGVRGQLGGADPPPQLPPTTVSVIVPTCDRAEDLRRCLTSLATQRTRHQVEIMVVDNRPASGVAREVLREFPGVRVVEEPRPGLSFARNAGIARAAGEIIVATDDDVMAPPGWVEKLLEPFARPEVAIVTGHVLPMALETEAQCRFEAYGGLGKGFTPIEADGEWFRTRRSAVPTWLLGATANAAFRASIFRDPAIGLMDEALGAGTPTGCSEDTYVFYRALKTGHTIVYEPSAYVWHRHRPTMESLRQQIYAYSKGHVAYHLTTWLGDGDRRALVRLAYSLPKTYAQRTWDRLRGYSDYPLSMILLELRGNLAGPLALWRSRRRLRRLGGTAPLKPVDGGQRETSGRKTPAEHSHAVPMESSISEGPAA